MSAQHRFSPLNLKGNERPRISATDHLCNLPGCFKYIDAGDWMIRWGSFDLHVNCAEQWCNQNGKEPNYDTKG